MVGTVQRELVGILILKNVDSPDAGCLLFSEQSICVFPTGSCVDASLM